MMGGEFIKASLNDVIYQDLINELSLLQIKQAVEGVSMCIEISNVKSELKERAKQIKEDIAFRKLKP